MCDATTGVILVTNSLETGGIERNIRMVAGHLSRRFTAEIWAIDGQPEDAGGLCELRVFKRSLKFDPLVVLRMRKSLREHSASIVHFYHFASGIHVLLANLTIPRRERKKMVFSFGSARKDSKIISSYFRIIGKCADHITANSPSVKRGLEAHGIPPEMIEVLPNGHDPRPFKRSRSKSELRQQLGLPIDHQLLVTTGRLIPSKRHCDLIESLSMMPNECSVSLVIVGDGPLMNDLRKQAVDHNVDHRVMFVGFQENVPDYLHACDLFVFPSETEGLPNSLIEAALAKIPAIACRAPGVIDVITHEHSGLLVAPRSPYELMMAITRLLSNPTLAHTLAASACDFALRRYSLTCMVSQVEQIYARVLGAAADDDRVSSADKSD
tara:strand:- start:251275 stop:252420 length:1146 start_codon:yes stop_codon:yes gene_type:complete